MWDIYLDQPKTKYIIAQIVFHTELLFAILLIVCFILNREKIYIYRIQLCVETFVSRKKIKRDVLSANQ